MSVGRTLHDCFMNCFSSVRDLLITINASVLVCIYARFASTSSSLLRVQLGFIEEVIAFIWFDMVFAQSVAIPEMFVFVYIVGCVYIKM